MDQLSEESQCYWDEIRLIDCHGSKCRRMGTSHAWDGYGIHCTACHGEIDDDMLREVELKHDYQTDFMLIDCRGTKCRRTEKTNRYDGNGLHCTACFGDPWSDSESDSE